MNSNDIEKWLRWELDGHSAFKQRAVDDTVKYVKGLEVELNDKNERIKELEAHIGSDGERLGHAKR